MADSVGKGFPNAGIQIGTSFVILMTCYYGNSLVEILDWEIYNRITK